MKIIKSFENWNKTKKQIWLIPTDKRLEDSIVKILKIYFTNEFWKYPVESINNALDLADSIKEKNPEKFIYIFYDEEHERLKFLGNYSKIDPTKENFIDTINIEEHELTAQKYNL